MRSAKLSVILIPFLYLFVSFFLPISLLTFLPALIIRKFVSILAKIFGGPALGKILTASATNHASIRGRGTSLVPFILKGVPDLNHIKNEFVNKVLNAQDPAQGGELLYPELRQTVVSWCGYLFWKDIENFQLPIRLLDIPEPVDINSPSGLELLRSFYEKNWKLGEEPLWELILVPGLDDHFSFVFTFDHALCDALGMQKLVDKLSYPSIRAKPKGKISPKVPWLIILIRTLFRIPYDTALYLELFIRTTLFAKTEPRQNANCEKRADIPNSGLTLALTKFSVPELKKIATSLNASLTAVLLSSLQAAIQNLWGGEENGSNILYFPTPGLRHPEKLRNVGGIGHVEVFQRDRQPEEKLRHIEDQFQSLKLSTFPMVVDVFGRLTGCLPPSLVRRMINGAAGNLKTFVLSTFIGSRHSFSICGYPVVGMGSVGSGHAGTRVVSFFAFSCEDVMSFTVMGDEGLVSEEDGQFLLKSVAEEFEALQDSSKRNSKNHISLAIIQN